MQRHSESSLELKYSKVFGHIGLLIFFLLSNLVLEAQDCGPNTIKTAQKLYEDGSIDKVSVLLKGCVEDKKLTDDDRFTAYKMLANIHLLLDEHDEARSAIVNLLEIDPSYKPKTNEESMLFVEMVDELRRSEEEPSFDEMVQSASRRAQRATDAPASIYVISRQEIEMRGYSNLLELLEDVPAVEIQKNSTNEFRNVVSFRGISGNEKFLILIDGIRVTPATGDPYVLGSNFALANAKRVEVILGPASALYGVDAFSGVINIYTRDGEEINGGSVSASFGQFNTTDNSFIFGTKKQKVDVSIAGNYYRSNEAPLYSIYKDDYSWYNTKYLPQDSMSNVDGSIIKTPISYDRSFEMPSSSYYLSAKVNFGDFEIGATRYNESHSSSTNVDPYNSIFTSNAFLSTGMQTLYATHIHRFELKKPKSSLTLQSLYSMTNFEMSPESGFINVYTGYDKGYKYQFSKSQKLEELIEYVINSKLDIVGGISYELLGALPKTADTKVPLDKNIPLNEQGQYYTGSELGGDSLAIPLDYYNLNYSNFGSFVQLHYKLNRKINLTFGSRYDYNSRYSGSINPRFGLVAKATDDLTFKLLYGKSFLAPSPWKSYLSYGSFRPVTNGGVTSLVSDFYHVPNNDLKPEQLHSFESSVTWLNGKKSRIDVGAYYNIVKDLISLQEGDPTQDSFKGVPVGFVETTLNLGEALYYGFSFRIIQKLLANKKQAFNVYMSYDYSSGYINVFQTDGTFKEMDLILSAPHTVKAGIDFNYQRLSGNLGALYRAKSNSVKTLRPPAADAVPTTTHNEDKHQAFTVLDLYLSYLINDSRTAQWRAFIKVNNVLNAKYYHVAGSTDSFSAAAQDPIRVNIGFKYSL